ncbi:MAG TPA: hypothetical protein VK826_16665 [Bacteroidia bacterium]|nr:hypothetical protein [Bacteroidia bacterium]
MSIQKANKNEVRKEIAALIDRIKELSDRIGTQREIPQSELDVILHRIEELHRKTVVWSYLNTLPEEIAHGEDWNENLISEPEEDSKIGDSIIQKPEPVNIEPPVAVEEEKPVAPSEPSEPEPKNVEETPRISMEFGHITSVSTTEPTNPQPVHPEPQIPKAEPTNIPPPQQPKLKDIRSFIGFNEKLMYIRQVFGGNANAYDDALNQINTMNSYDEAGTFLSTLEAEYQWNKSNEPVAIFMQTVKRRFS